MNNEFNKKVKNDSDITRVIRLSARVGRIRPLSHIY